jgi:hypothetical protein
MTNRERGSNQMGGRARGRRQRLYGHAKRIEQRAAALDDPVLLARGLLNSEPRGTSAQKAAP